MKHQPKLEQLVARIEKSWPEHRPFLTKSFAERDLATLEICEQLADIVEKIATTIPGGIDALCSDYRFLCEEIVMPEEVHFRRNGTYRLSLFADAERECYANPEFMNRYMNGLLLSDILWVNHARAFSHFANDFLPTVKQGADHLEVGPGHGIFLYFAATDDRIASVTGWDVSATSIANTRHAIDTLGITCPMELELQNLFDASNAPSGGQFDSIAMSEILEHLEDPVGALEAVNPWLRPGGKLWINVPANSPAPDHIFLFDGLDHACEVAEKAGLDVVDAQAFPMSGATLESAKKHKLAVSCVVTTQKPLRN